MSKSVALALGCCGFTNQTDALEAGWSLCRRGLDLSWGAKSAPVLLDSSDTRNILAISVRPLPGCQALRRFWVQFTHGGSGYSLHLIQWELYLLLLWPALILGILGKKFRLLCISFKLPFALFHHFVAPVLAKT